MSKKLTVVIAEDGICIPDTQIQEFCDSISSLSMKSNDASYEVRLNCGTAVMALIAAVSNGKIPANYLRILFEDGELCRVEKGGSLRPPHEMTFLYQMGRAFREYYL